MARSELESGKEELRSKQPMLSCLQLQIAVRAGKDYLHVIVFFCNFCRVSKLMKKIFEIVNCVEN